MTWDRAARVTGAIMDLVAKLAGDALRQHIESLLRDEFWEERQEGVADRGDDRQNCPSSDDL